MVLKVLQSAQFEPLQSLELGAFSLKMALLTVLTSIQRVGDLQVLSVSKVCLEFGQEYSHVVLRPQPSYVPKVPSTSFRDQVVNLQVLLHDEADPVLSLLCPVHTLRISLDRIKIF